MHIESGGVSSSFTGDGGNQSTPELNPTITCCNSTLTINTQRLQPFCTDLLKEDGLFCDRRFLTIRLLTMSFASQYEPCEDIDDLKTQRLPEPLTIISALNRQFDLHTSIEHYRLVIDRLAIKNLQQERFYLYLWFELLGTELSDEIFQRRSIGSTWKSSEINPYVNLFAHPVKPVDFEDLPFDPRLTVHTYRTTFRTVLGQTIVETKTSASHLSLIRLVLRAAVLQTKLFDDNRHKIAINGPIYDLNADTVLNMVNEQLWYAGQRQFGLPAQLAHFFYQALGLDTKERLRKYSTIFTQPKSSNSNLGRFDELLGRAKVRKIPTLTEEALDAIIKWVLGAGPRSRNPPARVQGLPDSPRLLRAFLDNITHRVPATAAVTQLPPLSSVKIAINRVLIDEDLIHIVDEDEFGFFVWETLSDRQRSLLSRNFSAVKSHDYLENPNTNPYGAGVSSCGSFKHLGNAPTLLHKIFTLACTVKGREETSVDTSHSGFDASRESETRKEIPDDTFRHEMRPSEVAGAGGGALQKVPSPVVKRKTDANEEQGAPNAKPSKSQWNSNSPHVKDFRGRFFSRLPKLD